MCDKVCLNRAPGCAAAVSACHLYKPEQPEAKGDKYQGYNHSIATILRGFEKWVEEVKADDPGETDYGLGFRESLPIAQEKLLQLADEAQREIDECRAAIRG